MQKVQAGYTLFEVVLSLILLTAILSMITAAINMHLHQLSAGRMQTEEARLARAIFDKLARDIRHVVLDQENTEETSAGDGMSESGTTDSLSASETAATSDAETSDTESSYDMSLVPETGFIGTALGIYGGQDWIQIDTRETLFGERFESTNLYSKNNLDDSLTSDRISTLKTSLYYLGEDTGTYDADETIAKNADSSLAAPESPDQEYDRPIHRYGLYRRWLDRSVTEYAMDNGLEDDLLETEDTPLAPEVDNMEFSYYDGTDWLSEWNMDESRTLPAAVRIILTIRRKDYDAVKSRGLSAVSEENKRAVVYSLTIPTSLELAVVSEETSAGESSTSTEQ
jgi:hypothetical protein